MSITETLTPKNTEEVKPGLFIQKTKKGYRSINPVAWNGKIRWKEQLRTVISLRTFTTLAIIIFLAWSYTHDNKALVEFHDTIIQNPYKFCSDLQTATTNARGSCTEFLAKQGMCDPIGTNYTMLNSTIEVIP